MKPKMRKNLIKIPVEVVYFEIHTFFDFIDLTKIRRVCKVWLEQCDAQRNEQFKKMRENVPLMCFGKHSGYYHESNCFIHMKPPFTFICHAMPFIPTFDKGYYKNKHEYFVRHALCQSKKFELCKLTGAIKRTTFPLPLKFENPICCSSKTCKNYQPHNDTHFFVFHVIPDLIKQFKNVWICFKYLELERFRAGVNTINPSGSLLKYVLEKTPLKLIRYMNCENNFEEYLSKDCSFISKINYYTIIYKTYKKYSTNFVDLSNIFSFWKPSGSEWAFFVTNEEIWMKVKDTTEDVSALLAITCYNEKN